jgi:glucosamine kinase
VGEERLFLGIDGGGTRCRARLADAAGNVLGEGEAGPANIRQGLEECFRAVRDATGQCVAQAGLPGDPPIVACLALAGASEPAEAAAARGYSGHGFRRMLVTTDAHAACVGAHRGEDGGVIVVGTGSIGWAIVGGRQHRVGGWALPVSDEGSGAWLGCEALRRTLWAHDGRAAWTPLLRAISEQLGSDPSAIVRWTGSARPRDFAALAPLVVEHAHRSDAEARALMRLAARHVDALAARLAAHGASRLALAGGLARSLEPWLSSKTRKSLVAPAGDALDGALRLARAAAGVIPEMRVSAISGTRGHESRALPRDPGSRLSRFALGRDDKRGRS